MALGAAFTATAIINYTDRSGERARGTVREEGGRLHYFYGLSVVLKPLFVFIGKLHWKLPDALHGSARVRLD